MIGVDTSVIVPALVEWHEAHARVQQELSDVHAPAHAYFESFSVLTRMPQRVLAEVAAAALEGLFGGRVLPLTRSSAEVVALCAERGIEGGAVYDAIVALACVEHRVKLLTRDRRAVRTYEALDAEVVWID